MKSIQSYIFLFLKGLAMGAADIVPGVSGGTIAFISGIYEELLGSISAIKPSLWKTFIEKGIKAVWQQINGNFLTVLFLGIATSIVSLAKVIEYFLHHHPIVLWSFFFGLILASIIYVGKEIKQWNWKVILGLILGAVFVVYLSLMPPLSPNENLIFLFFAGMIAICAMILPGISGSFILLILGAYSVVISALSGLYNSEIQGSFFDKISFDSIKILAVIGIGAVTGLLLFSNALKWLLKNHNQTMLGVLTGFLVGSLWKIWPWKKDELVYVKKEGVKEMSGISNEFGSLSAYLQGETSESFEQYKSYVEHNILPSTYEQINSSASNQMMYAAIACILGFSIIFILEKIAVNRKNV